MPPVRVHVLIVRAIVDVADFADVVSSATAPARPFFVVTTTTPFAASVPYSVAADGPFTISMSSISSGLSVLNSEKGVSVPEFVVAGRDANAVDDPDRRVAQADRRHAAHAHGRRAADVDPGSTMTPGALAMSRSADRRDLGDCSTPCRRRRASNGVPELDASLPGRSPS